MTEDEAKDRLCPFLLNQKEDSDKHCIALLCMAWESHYNRTPKNYGKKLKSGYCQLIKK